MSQIKPVLNRAARSDEWRSRVLRRFDKQGLRSQVVAEIVNALTDEQEAQALTGIDLQGHTLHCKVTACFQAVGRREAVALLEHLTPVPLTFVKFLLDYRPEQGIWPVTYESASAKIIERYEIAPFVYTVTQGNNFGPLNELSWVTHLESGRSISVSCRITNDPARFVKTERGRQVHVRGFGKDYAVAVGQSELGQSEYRWERTGDWPVSWTTGFWNRWSSDAGESAYCTAFWPLRKFGGPPHEALAQMARRLLEVREEGQAHE